MPDLDALGVVITGGAGDIGAAMACEMADRGASMTVIDSKAPDDAAPWLDGIREHGSVDYIQADVRDRTAIADALSGVQNLYAVVSNAAIGGAVAAVDIEPDYWDEVLGVNLTGSFNVAQLAARELQARGTGGRLLFTGSWVQEVPWPDITAYAVAKAGVRMLARQMALELADSGILVNVVAPGIVDAGLAKQLREDDPVYAERIKRVIPLGQLQTPEQVAKAAAFLCSPDSDYITGTVLLTDGGCSLHKFD